MKNKGLSMVELVLSIAVGAVIALTVVSLLKPFDNVMFTFWRRSGTTEAQTAMTRMLQEVERIKSPGQISAFTAENLAFVDIQNQVVSFQKTGTDLMRNTDVLARNVVSLAFSYLDGNGNPAATAAAIRVVNTTLVITSGNQQIRLQSGARVRNGV